MLPLQEQNKGVVAGDHRDAFVFFVSAGCISPLYLASLADSRSDIRPDDLSGAGVYQAVSSTSCAFTGADLVGPGDLASTRIDQRGGWTRCSGPCDCSCKFLITTGKGLFAGPARGAEISIDDLPCRDIRWGLDLGRILPHNDLLLPERILRKDDAKNHNCDCHKVTF